MSKWSVAQLDSAAIKHKLELVTKVRMLLTDSLKLNIGEKFYTEFAENDSMFCYVYVSRKDSVHQLTDGAFIYFGNHPASAKVKADSFTRTGFDAMVYKTAGTSAAFLNQRLLEYDDLSLVFILIHEAVHRHLRNTKSKLPYEFEEALGDVLANSFCGWYSGSSVNNYLAFAYRNEQIYRLINRCSEKKISKQKCERKINKQLKGATMFQKDRYEYTVNNAYLLRYSSYARHYFELREVYQRMHNPKSFMEEMVKMPVNVVDCEDSLRSLKKKY